MLQRTPHLLPIPTWRPWARRWAVSEDLKHFVQFLIFLVILCSAIYVYVQPASEISATQARIAELQSEYERLQRENTDIIRQMAPYTDIRCIEERAKELGYQPPERRMVVQVQIPSETLAAAQPEPETTPPRPWWRTTLDWIVTRVSPPAYAQAER